MSDQVERLKAALADRYTIDRELGAGGMATVYLATDLKHDRKVAVKVLRPELAAVLGTERFLREIKIAAQLHHPHILQLYDSGDADGFLYYVMPYVNGESLRDRLTREGELPIADAVRILNDVADALAKAHSEGVVHRDVKPDNVMLSDRHALVADFGVAKAVSEATGHEQLTTAGVALGTPAYMAPEQATAESHIDHRADIYAVGALAYELLTGRPPFTGATQQEVLAAHVTKEPEALSKQRIDISADLELVVLRCLEKNPDHRWQTAEELLTALDSFTTPSGGAAPTGMAAGRADGRWWKVWAAIGASAVILAVTATLLILWPSEELNPDQVVVAVFDNETGEESLDYVGRMAADWITQGLMGAGVVQVVPWPDALQAWSYVAEEADAGRSMNVVRAIAEETGAPIVVSGRYYLERDSLHFRLDVIDAREGVPIGGELPPVSGSSDAVREVIAELRDRTMGYLAVSFDERIGSVAPLVSTPPTIAAYREFNEGMNWYVAGEYPEANERFESALKLNPNWFPALRLLLINMWNQGRWKAMDSVLSGASLLDSTLTEYERAWVGHLRAWVDGDIDRSLVEIRRAAEMSPGSKAVYNLGSAANRAFRPREAIDALLSLDPTRGAMRDWTRYWNRLTDAYHMLGEYELELQAAHRAEAQYPQNLWRVRPLAALGRLDGLEEVIAESIASRPPHFVRTQLRRAAEILRVNGNGIASVSIANRLLTYLESRPSEEVNSVHHRQTMGWVLYLVGRADEARYVLDELLEDPHLIQSQYRFDVRGMRGYLAAMAGDLDQANEDLRWFAALDGTYLKGRHTYWRAVITGALGDPDEAVRLLRQAYRDGRERFANDAEHAYLDPIRDHPGFRELMTPRG